MLPGKSAVCKRGRTFGPEPFSERSCKRAYLPRLPGIRQVTLCRLTRPLTLKFQRHSAEPDMAMNLLHLVGKEVVAEVRAAAP